MSLFLNIFLSLFLAALGFHCCVGFVVVVSEAYRLVVVLGVLIVVASVISEHRLLGMWVSTAVARGLSSWGSQALEHSLGGWGSRALEHRLSSCSTLD